MLQLKTLTVSISSLTSIVFLMLFSIQCSVFFGNIYEIRYHLIKCLKYNNIIAIELPIRYMRRFMWYIWFHSHR